MKCPKCDYNNLDGVTKCGNCNYVFIKKKIGCPKCATKNDIGSKKCKKCGYLFSKNNGFKSVLKLLLIIIMLIFLCLIVFIKNNIIVKKVQIIMATLSIIAIGILIVREIIFSSKNKLDLRCPELIITNDNIDKLKKISLLMFGLLIIVVIGVLIFLFFKYGK